jgi:hypothetical protein
MDSGDFLAADCGVCNRSIDICLISQCAYGDAEMVQCKNGHYFCTKHLLRQPTPEEKWDFVNKFSSWETPPTKEELDGYWEDCDSEYFAECPPDMCPVCCGGGAVYAKRLTYQQLLDFALKELGITQTELRKRIKQKCRTYEDFINYCKATRRKSSSK